MTLKRRPKGSGSIIATPEGKFRVLFAFSPGKPREDIDGSPFATYDDAERALALETALAPAEAST